MTTDETRRQKFGAKAIIPVLGLLILLGAGCSEKETAAPESDASAHAPAPQIAEIAAPPPVAAPEPIIGPDEPIAASEPDESASGDMAPEPIVEPDAPKAASEPEESASADMTPEPVKEFVPTHTVRTNLNLRPLPSLNTTPIVILKAGSEVEYIKENDGWFYVDTQLHGKGWCSSEYLTAVSPP